MERSDDPLRRHVPYDAEIQHWGPPDFMTAANAAPDALLAPAPRRHSETFAPDLSFGDGIDRARPCTTSVRQRHPGRLPVARTVDRFERGDRRPIGTLHVLGRSN